MGRNSQRIKILHHFATRGELTAYQAWKEYGISRLASRIYDLRSAGWPIVKEWRIVEGREGPARIAVYKSLRHAD